jgi:hypothetical protein
MDAPRSVQLPSSWQESVETQVSIPSNGLTSIDIDWPGNQAIVQYVSLNALFMTITTHAQYDSPDPRTRADTESSPESGVSGVHSKVPEVLDHICSRDEGKQ